MVTTARGSQSQGKQTANALGAACQAQMVPTSWGISLKRKDIIFCHPSIFQQWGAIFRVLSWLRGSLVRDHWKHMKIENSHMKALRKSWEPTPCRKVN